MTTTDDRIVTAAVRLFVEKGTTQVTISELAQEANVARGTLYRNVGSMDDLFDRVVGEITAICTGGSRRPSGRSTTPLRGWRPGFGCGCATRTRTRNWAGSLSSSV